MATTTRVSDGGLAKPSEFSGVSVSRAMTIPVRVKKDRQNIGKFYTLSRGGFTRH
jgi:hypothetical protein